ncbi:MAG: MipA/OmpV family protein [Aestuariibacter sp.]
MSFISLLAFQVHAGEWGAGVGVVAYQAPQVGVSSEVLPVPFFTYEGEDMDIGLGSISFHIVSSEHLRLSVDGQVRFNGYEASESAALNGMEDRDFAFDAGISGEFFGEWGGVTARALKDVTGTHDGYELSLAYQYPFPMGNLIVIPSIGVAWQSEELVTYYYGVKPQEATAERAEYSADSTLIPYAEIMVGYQLNRNWQLLSGASYTALGSEIKNSPIIEESHELSAFAAIKYTF